MSQGQGLDDVIRLMSPVSIVTGAGSVGDSQGSEPVQSEVDISKIPGLFKALEHVERACVLNTYHDKVSRVTMFIISIIASYLRINLIYTSPSISSS